MVQLLDGFIISHPIYDSLFTISIVAAITSGMYFRKQTLMMKKQLQIATQEAAGKAKDAEMLQNRVNDEIMGYSASPGILAKMGLTERVFLIAQQAVALDKKTDLQNLVINDVARTVKQLLPNGGTSLADKIDKMGAVLDENTVQLSSNSERLISHLVTSETVKQDLSDRITHIETMLSKEGNHDKV